jgi:predicted nucleic acid-binding protein
LKIYLDSSWLLKVLLQQGAVKPLPAGAQVFSSVLLQVECRRTLDRHYKRQLIGAEHFARLSQQLSQYMEFFSLLEVNQDIALRASEPFSTPLGTLDALHLATAIKIREAEGEELALATFDNELAIAAMAHGFTVIAV